VGPASLIRRAAPDRARVDLPIQHRIGLVIALASVGGFALGVYAQRYNGVFWHLSGALILGLGVLWWLTGWWVVASIVKLADQAQRLSRTGLTSALKALPVGRSDEIGRIAQALHTLGVSSTKSYLEAQSLRRTMDQQITLATRKATNELNLLVMRDALTGLGNRRSLDDKKDSLFEHAARSGEELACVMFDLDHFKQINDTLGHEAGDHLLVFLGGLIKAVGRSEDLAIRLGGDEFLILMPGTDEREAEELAETIKKHFIRQANTLFPDIKMLGLSFGISSLGSDRSADLRTMMRVADRRLYGSKGSGRR
jgi:diguanylate cyclase (GGDEF)-like protein